MFGPHSERKLIAIKIKNVKVAHTVVVILRRLEHFCSARSQVGVHTVDVFHEYTNAAIARQSFGLVR